MITCPRSCLETRTLGPTFHPVPPPILENLTWGGRGSARNIRPPKNPFESRSFLQILKPNYLENIGKYQFLLGNWMAGFGGFKLLGIKRQKWHRSSLPKSPQLPAEKPEEEDCRDCLGK